jgi:hypothetical protein
MANTTSRYVCLRIRIISVVGGGVWVHGPGVVNGALIGRAGVCDGGGGTSLSELRVVEVWCTSCGRACRYKLSYFIRYQYILIHSMLIVYSTIWLHTYPYGNPSPIRCLHTDKFKPKSPQHFQQTNNTIGRFFFLGSFLSLCSFGPSVSKPMRLAKKDPAGIAKRLKFIHDAERKHTYFYELHVAMAIISP